MDTRGIMKITSGCLLVVLWTVICRASGNALQDAKSSSCDCEGITEKLQTLQEQMQTQRKHSQSEQEQMQSQIAVLSKLIVTMFEDKKIKDELNTHNITKREIPSDGNPEDSMPCKLNYITGLRGLPGRDGVNGRDGRDGRDGVSGSPVPRGDIEPAGPPGPPVSPSIVETIENGGAVYTRWGRTTCGDESTVLYEGFAGGSYYNNTGGGVNYQCLPLDPEYNSYSGDVRNWQGSRMAGVEYQENYGLFPSSAYQQNVPCARCYTENRSAVMMIPAKRTCPVDWTKEYEGYLMAEYHSDPRTTFECVDASPEYIKGQEANTNGALFYFIKPYCSGTATTGHCPPYYGNKELTCVVCTK